MNCYQICYHPQSKKPCKSLIYKAFSVLADRAGLSSPGAGCEWRVLRLTLFGLDRAHEHHHIDFLPFGHAALAVVQHYQAIGLGHRVEHA